MSPRSAVIGVAAFLVVATACAIQPDEAPRDVPAGERLLLDPVDPAAGATACCSRVFLLTSDEDNGERQLRSVPRRTDQTPTAVLNELILGPNQQELEAGLRSDLPETLTLSARPPVAGTMSVDVSPEILELPGSALRLAVAQIVFTANELEGVRNVRLRVDGELRGWPDGTGELQNAPLSVYDYPGLAESAQPAYPPVPSEPAS